MADSIASLRIKLDEAKRRIIDLEKRKPEIIERIVEVDRIIETPVPERVVEVPVPFEVIRVEYRDVIKEVQVPGPERTVYRDVPVEVPGPERIVERIVEVPGPTRDVEKLVPFEVQVPMYPPSVQRVEVIKEVYVDNPAHIEMIQLLQERVCQFTSQLDSLQNPTQDGQSSQGVAE